MARHFQIIVETITPSTIELSPRPIRLRPLRGQGFSSDTRVAFSTKIRYEHPVGTLFKVWVTMVNDPRKRYPRAVRDTELELVTSDEAKAFISDFDQSVIDENE